MKKYRVYLLLILLFAFALRTYKFDERVYIFGDAARDALVARASLQNHTLPPIASFSSAGPFVFAPNYYWFLMAVYAVAPNVFSVYFYFLTAQSIFFVYLSTKIARLIGNKRLALFTGLVAAAAPRQIIRATAMTQHTIVGVTSMLALFYAVKFIKNGKLSSIFWSAFWIGMAISMHYQALGLLIFLAAVLVIKTSLGMRAKAGVLFVAGLLIPLVPLFVWDAGQNFANVNNLMDYLLIGQYRIYVANRWMWHIFQFWPGMMGDLAGGNVILGGALFCLLLLTAGQAIIKHKMTRPVGFMLAGLLFFFVYLRFYRGEKFEGYLIYLHPLIIMLLSWGAWQALHLKKILLLTAGGIIFFFNLFFLKDYYASLKVNQQKELQQTLANMQRAAGKTSKFAVYDFADARWQTETWDYTESLSLFLDTKQLLDDKGGVKFGICRNNCPEINGNYIKFNDKNITRINYRAYIIKEAEARYPMVPRTPSAVQKEILFWWQARPLKSTFNLGKFILERVPRI